MASLSGARLVIEPRIASSVQVSAFIRRANAGGDFATVLKTGDPVSGAILLIGLVRGREPQIYERFPSMEGGSSWQMLPGKILENEQDLRAEWQKRAARDPDLWVLELDVASTERLIGLLD